jgi:hypothetical protein
MAETDKHVAWGPGPRASQALMLAAPAPARSRRPPRAVDRRRARAGRTGAAAPHGADLRRARGRHKSLPPAFVPSSLSEIVVLSDFWSPLPEIQATLAGLSSTGAHGSLVQIVDPAEETFPYSGRIDFVEPEGAGTDHRRPRGNLGRRLHRPRGAASRRNS